MSLREPSKDQSQTIELRLPTARTSLDFSGERYTSQAQGTIEHEHVHRYLFALQFCRGKRVLDIACGEGYGSAALALVCDHVTGIDIDEETIAHCRANYAAPNVDFVVGGATSIPLPDHSMDVVVSFETLEHMVEHDGFLKEISRVLRNDGLLVISTPDKDIYSPPGTPSNEFHLRELTRGQFEQLLATHFPFVRMAGQLASSSSTISPVSEDTDAGIEFFHRSEQSSYFVSSHLRHPIYLIALASRRHLEAVPTSQLLDNSFLPQLHAAYRAELERVWAEVRSRDDQLVRQTEALQAAHIDTARYFDELKGARQDADQARDDAAGLQAELASERTQVAELGLQLGEARTSIDHLQVSVAALQSTIAALHASTSWRITRPVRALGRTLRSPKLSRLVRSIRARLAGHGGGIPIPSASGVPSFVLTWVRRLQGYTKLSASNLFSPDWYLAAYPDVARAGKNPVWHYLLHGAAEGRDPGPSFSTTGYLRRYPDVAASGLNPLAHYLQFGIHEGRSASPFAILSDPSGAEQVRSFGLNAHSATASIGVDEPDDRKLLADAVRSCDRLRSTSPVNGLHYRPLISVLLPTYNTPVQYLELCVDSVIRQSYEKWELIIVDDCSTSLELAGALERLADRDHRIRVKRNPVNQGISGATNDAMALANGEFVAMLDHDDELLDDALLEIVRALNKDPKLDAVYTDQDYIEADGRPSGLLLKPDWSPTLFWGVMFVGHLLVVRKTLATEIGGFDSRFNNVQDFEFMLRVAEQTSRIAHVEKVLYHWRRIPGSVAYHGDAKSNIEVLQSRAVSAHLSRLGIGLIATPHARHAHRATLRPVADMAPASVLVIPMPGSDLGRLAQLIEAAQGPHRVRIGSEAEARLGEQGTAAIRRMIAECGANCIVTVGADVIRFESDDWLQQLIAFANVPGAGAVCGIGIGEDRAVLDAGLILTAPGVFTEAMKGWSVDGDGYAGSLSCAREVIAVRGSVMAVSVRTFEELGGFDELLQTMDCAWTDLSARATHQGCRNLVLPTVLAVRHPAAATATASSQLDALLLTERWRQHFVRDPYHNRHFDVRSGGYGT